MYQSGSNSDIPSLAFGFELYHFISYVKKKSNELALKQMFQNMNSMVSNGETEFTTQT